ncbi:hypothetical protein ACROYT_G021412 [Oculina patagonica]
MLASRVCKLEWPVFFHFTPEKKFWNFANKTAVLPSSDPTAFWDRKIVTSPPRGTLSKMAATGVVRPKTHRGKRAIEERAPKDVENTKTALFLRGGRTSETVTQAMKDLCSLKKPNAVMFQKKNIMRPFEDHTSLEFFSVRNDASLFLFGSHSKKRPHNLVIGRCFDGHILDMIELGIDKFISLNDIKI